MSLVFIFLFFFSFFKQKTAYEITEGDWSSDVCSSDLARPRQSLRGRGRPRHARTPARGGARSEEHTSELQSPSVISYAVFCLKKKKKKTNIQFPPTNIKKHKTKP